MSPDSKAQRITEYRNKMAFFFSSGMLWIYFMFSRLFNNMENNIILSETL